LSSLIAQDNFPQSHNLNRQDCRMSMNDIFFPIDSLKKEQKGKSALSSSVEVIDKEENPKHPYGIENNENVQVIIPPILIKKYHHSCPGMAFHIVKLDKM
jgi:hypothetical protein